MAISFDARALNDLSRDLRKVAPATYRASQKVIRGVALEIYADAAQRASFSARISQSGKVRMHGLNATITFGGGNAWFVVPIENRGAGSVTHPTFGHLPNTSKDSHGAILAPAFNDKAEVIDKALGDAVVEATTIVLGAR